MTQVEPSSDNPSERARDPTRATCVVSEHANHYATGDPDITINEESSDMTNGTYTVTHCASIEQTEDIEIKQ